MKERPVTEPPKRLENGLIDFSNTTDTCKYVTEIYIDEYHKITQSIMFNYLDDIERNYVRSTVYCELHLKSRQYFNDQGKMIFKEDHI